MPKSPSAWQGRSIVAVCHQIGSARAVAPVIRRLAEHGFPIYSFAYDLSAEGFNEAGISFAPLDPSTTSFDDMLRQTGRILAATEPAVVLSGTSAGQTWEKAFVISAKRRRIAVVSVLDNWLNYDARFSGPTGALHYGPDLLCVMNDAAELDLRDYGFPADALAVTGQPYLDEIAAARVDREHCRSIIGVARNDRVIVFASEPQGRDAGNTLGYTEVEVLKGIVEVVASFHSPDLFLLVRPHPTEMPHELLRILQGAQIRSAVSDSGSSREVIGAAELVIGMTSLFLLEAALLGRKTISFRPGAAAETFIGTRLEITMAAANLDDLRRLVTAALQTDADEQAIAMRTRVALNVHGSSAEKIAGIVSTYAQRRTATTADLPVRYVV